MRLFRRSIAQCVLALAALTAGIAPASAAPLQHVVLAGGCFWGMQAVFQPLKGVRQDIAGYSGGAALTAHYDIVSTGMTGHAESVEIAYDPSQISFQQLLDVYFLVAHDPTELNRQGPDEGSQYRSEIFYTTPAQRAQALAYIQNLERKRVYSGRVVTLVRPLRAFYPAEAYHQDFVAHNADNPYVVVNDLPKLARLRKIYPQLLR